MGDLSELDDYYWFEEEEEEPESTAADKEYHCPYCGYPLPLWISDGTPVDYCPCCGMKLEEEIL